DRGRAGILCRSDKIKLHRTRRFARNKRKRTARKAGAISNERKRTSAATALCSLRERRAHWRSNKRHPFSELELGRGHGVCLDGAREKGRPKRYRHRRTTVYSSHRKTTTREQIMTHHDAKLKP